MILDVQNSTGLPKRIDLVSSVDVLRRPSPEWDGFVGTHPHGDVVQSTVWGLSKQDIGRVPLLITARRKDGVLVGGALLVDSPLKLGVRMAYIARGPVVIGDNPSVLRAVLETAVACSRARRLGGLIVQLPEGCDERDHVLDEADFAPGGIAVAPEATIRIDITQENEAILRGMSGMRRRNLRRAPEAALDIGESEDVGTFHALHRATSRRGDFTPLSLDYIQAQWRALAPSSAVSLLLARYHGKPVAGVWLSRFGGVVTFRLAGWDPAPIAPKHVNEALHWAAIQWSRAKGAHTYDFGGFDRVTAERILNGEPPAAGFERSHHFFKLGFCGTPVLLPRARFLLLNSLAHRAARSIVPVVLRSRAARGLAQGLRS
jgi:lipid II:glycine glycyltransferase (peptidoglycan interpeptide bridge formation enzyme)